MQILSTALPGFRDLRGPLIAGYLWLVWVWLVVKPDLDKRPTDPLAAAMYDLGHEVSRVGLVIGVGVVAYLIGAVSQAASDVLRAGARRAVYWVGEFIWVITTIRPIESFGQFLKALVDVPFPIQAAEAQQRLEAAVAELDTLELDGPWKDWLFERISRRYAQLTSEARGELQLSATLLVGGDQQELYAEIDRLGAESQLRSDVALPLLALALLGAVQSSPWWLAAIPLIGVLFMTGLVREGESRRSITNAMQAGRISSFAVQRADKWIESEWPKLRQQAVDGSTLRTTPPED